MLTDAQIKSTAIAFGLATEVADAGYENDLLWFDGDMAKPFRAIESVVAAPLLEQIDELESQLAAVAKDAERFIHIATNLDHDGFGAWLPELCIVERVESSASVDEVRQAIDAAIARTKEQM